MARQEFIFKISCYKIYINDYGDGWFYGMSAFVGSVSLFNGISTLFRLFNAKSILLEEQ